MADLAKVLGTSILESKETKDQIPRQDEVFPIFKRDLDEIELRDLHLVLKSRNISDSFIVGHKDYGIIGETPLGMSGLPNAPVFRRVVNWNNVFYEFFRTNLFNDSALTTLQWDTVNFKLRFGPGDGTRLAYSNPIFLNSQTVLRATLDCIEDKPAGTNIKYYLSANAGADWEEVFRGQAHTFIVSGQDLRFKIEMQRNPGSDEPSISELSVAYEV